MYCPDCGAEIDDQETVCPHCQTRIEAAVSSSGESRQTQSTTPQPNSSQTGQTTGIKIIAGLSVLGGIITIFGGLLLLGVSNEPGAPGWVGPFSIFLIGGSSLNFVLAYGLWNLKSWAWKFGVVWYILGIISGLFSLFSGQPQGIISAVTATIIAWYLYDNRFRFQSNDAAVA